MIETARLAVRKFSEDDAEFMLRLLNEPSFLRYVGDRGVRTIADACKYIREGPLASYERHGFGLYLVELKDSRVPIGICGLLKRESLEDCDVGFAFLTQFWSKGYAFEAASAVLAQARAAGRKRILAITSQDNIASIALLEKLGFRFDRLAQVYENEPELSVFVS
jgi:RimJ/RimL family protein N-acetyltransferase